MLDVSAKGWQLNTG